MKRLIPLLLIFLFLPLCCLSETTDSDNDPIILYSDGNLILKYDSIDIYGSTLYINCIAENNTDHDLKVRFSRCVLNGWDIVDSSLFDGHIFVKNHSNKRTRFDFDKGSFMAGISDPEEAETLDYTLHITHEGESTVYYDSPEPVVVSLIKH